MPDQKISELIVNAWDQNFLMRSHDIETGVDLTYNNIIIPYIKKTIQNLAGPQDTILDIGSGCGYLTNIIAQEHPRITGIDISEESVRYARKKYPGISFINGDICKLQEFPPVDLCLAVMVLNYVPNLSDFFLNVNNLLTRSGVVVFLVPHPFYWPLGRISDKKTFDYRSENLYTIPFQIRNNKKYPADILYFHRPLEIYFKRIFDAHFSVRSFTELYEDDADGLKTMPHMLSMVLTKNCPDGIGR
jgi:SAM-dependent methyltransferase